MPHPIPAPYALLAAFLGGVATAELLRRVCRCLWSSSFEFETAIRVLQLDAPQVLRLRRHLFCGAQSVSYANSTPLVVVRGRGALLFDAQGRDYLDTRNNVGHVGWQHPRVTRAVATQLGACNANSRYLHPARVLLAQELLKTLPPPLRDGVVFFVNSGSEATDLALRLARGHTRRDKVVCVAHGYHGHTEAALEVSPYKFLGRGGTGPSPRVTVVPCPDVYRGRYRVSTTPTDAADEKELEQRGAEYAAHVEEAVAAGDAAAFITESGMSVGGLVMPPRGYLRRCYAAIRASGGVAMADEVQLGLGRLGTHFWGFEEQRVCPDLLTLGKAFGNGFPLAAVVCRRGIAESFAATGMEYFNTFGGNPVACVAGLAVLEVLRDEGLQERARGVGAFLKQGFLALAEKAHGRLIGDVRGGGFFLGVDLVIDRTTREGATKETSVLCTRLLERHRILTTIDGPQDNVIVIKPPMCFGMREAQRFLEAVDTELRGMQGMDFRDVSHTPT